MDKLMSNLIILIYFAVGCAILLVPLCGESTVCKQVASVYAFIGALAIAFMYLPSKLKGTGEGKRLDELLIQKKGEVKEVVAKPGSKYIIFSDQHRGDNSWADDFAHNQVLFFHALSDYLKKGYTYIELGDGDELWENTAEEVHGAHSHAIWLIRKFLKEGRLHVLWGNHDEVTEGDDSKRALMGYLFSWDKVDGEDAWRLRRYLRDHLGISWVKSSSAMEWKSDRELVFSSENRKVAVRLYWDTVTIKEGGRERKTLGVARVKDKIHVYDNDIKLLEGLILDIKSLDAKVYLVHGHQADPETSNADWIGKLVLRNFWMPLQLYGIRDSTSPAKNFTYRSAVDKTLENWIDKKKGILIAGHTHRPVFPHTDKRYFNSGSCVHPRCITGIELIDDETKGWTIALVKWHVTTVEGTMNKTVKGKVDKVNGVMHVTKEMLEKPKKLSEFL